MPPIMTAKEQTRKGQHCKISKIVAIPDIHHAPNLDQIEATILHECPDLTVFLGDYFDQFGDSPGDAGRTAAWLKHSLNQPARIHLWGNHDLRYGFPDNSCIRCSGFSVPKLVEIRKFLSDEDWAKLRFSHWERNWLFTHAGWSNFWGPKRRIKNPERHLSHHVDKAIKSLMSNQRHWLFGAGYMRGGSQLVGGLTWCDLSEFAPISRINQVFGHTPGEQIRIINGLESRNYCIDTTDDVGVHHYLVLDGDEALIRSIDNAS